MKQGKRVDELSNAACQFVLYVFYFIPQQPGISSGAYNVVYWLTSRTGKQNKMKKIHTAVLSFMVKKQSQPTQYKNEYVLKTCIVHSTVLKQRDHSQSCNLKNFSPGSLYNSCG